MNNKELHYFASDGNYGAWEGRSVILETSVFTGEDWDRIDMEPDESRAQLAYDIYRMRKGLPIYD